jgi:hypothetical protein
VPRGRSSDGHRRGHVRRRRMPRPAPPRLYVYPNVHAWDNRARPSCAARCVVPHVQACCLARRFPRPCFGARWPPPRVCGPVMSCSWWGHPTRSTPRQAFPTWRARAGRPSLRYREKGDGQMGEALTNKGHWFITMAGEPGCGGTRERHPHCRAGGRGAPLARGWRARRGAHMHSQRAV